MSRTTAYRVQYQAIPHDRAAGQPIEKQEQVLRNHPEKKALADLLLREKARVLIVLEKRALLG